MKARFGVPAEKLQPEHARESARDQRSRPPDQQLDQRERPRDERVDAGQRPREPHHEERPEREHDSAEQRPAEPHSQQPSENKRPKRREEQLQHRHDRERLPERQHVGRDAERREHGGLPVCQQRTSRHHVRVPQRSRRKLGGLYCRNGSNTSAGSASSKLVPSPGTFAGFELAQGAELSNVSDPDSVRPGSTPCPTSTTDSSA